VKIFLDTSVMVAAFWGDHRDHDASLRVFAEATPETAACGVHSLAEVYATMTALPVRPLLAPEQVFLFVQQIAERLTPVVLDTSENLETIRKLSERQLSSRLRKNANFERNLQPALCRINWRGALTCG